MVGDGVKSATLMDVTITGKDSGDSYGVYARGGKVTLNMVTISKVGVGVRVEKGVLIMNQGSVKGFTGTGVMVGDGVESASLMGTTITGKGSGSTGVYARGGNVTLNMVNISQVEMGVEVEKGVLIMNQGSVKGFTGTGVMVGEGVESAELTRVMITGGGSGTGVYARGAEGMVMRLEGVTISRVGTGVEVEKGTLIMNQGSVKGFTEYGVMVGEGVESASLTGTTITGEGSGTGVYAVGGNVTLNMVNILKVQTGVRVMGGKSLTITGGSVKGFTEYGVMVGEGVESASLMGTTITGKGSGYGIHAVGGNVTLSEVEISKVAMGVEVEKGTLIMNQGSVTDFAGTGVSVGSGVRSASLMGAKIMGDGKGTGVMMMGGDVMLNMVNILKVKTGVRVEKGMLKILEGSVTEFTGTGVMVGSEVKSASLMGTTITGDGKGTGVYAERGTNLTMMLENVTISGVGTGVRMMGGKSLTITGGSIKEVQTGIVMMKGESLMIRENSTINFMGEYGVYVGNGVTKADLVRVMIEGNGKGTGTGIYAVGGNVMVSGGEIKRCKWG
ncbi:right-handed parallel beta-helix repeat-containing protein [Bartonella schoenbuchensis]|uniref:Right handed beta helix region n=1 Tax=Bartonella schoenbuchensis (strain DSM 13525 / NCTC 13165 / R1) TaxID=687861 RepID=A0A1S6XRL3_BARSR|nr:right-handed parallel beta-helix repeat-containing protein [Bartonella schoenbuchensis]AQX31206.1 Right handed beta helix region [Bartonella schoenbuchensis R1]